MNLLEALAAEHSKAQCDKIVKYVGNDPARFAQLVKLFLKGPYRITQRAGWPLGYCTEKHPDLIRPHLKMIVQNLRQPGLHDAIKRNTVRLLQFIDIPRSLQGMVALACFELFGDKKQAIAVRVFSMTVLARLAMAEPAMKNELKILIEDNLTYSSPAFRSRAGKVLKQLG